MGATVKAIAALCLASTLAGCKPAAPTPTSPTPPAADLVWAARQQVELAFRPAEAGTFEVRHPLWMARLGAGGRAVLQARGGAPWVLSPAEFFRGGARLESRQSAPRPDGPARLAIDRGLAVERWENRPGGLEQTWTFAAAPRGEGELVLRLPTSGLGHSATTPSGVHFRAGTAPGFLYGVATWVDAAGARTALPLEYHAGAVTIRVPERTLAATHWPAVLDPVLSAEFSTDAPVASSSAPGDQQSQAVAAGGGVFLVAWGDKRFGAEDILAARVSASGQLLDPAGIVICNLPRTQDYPEVAFDGTNFLVLWSDLRGNNTIDLAAARVTPGGAVLDAQGTILIADTDFKLGSSLAFDGTNHLIAWHATRGSTYLIRAARVSKQLTVLDPSGLTLDTGVGIISRPSVASNGSSFVVAWDDYTNVFAAHLSPGGVVTGGAPFGVATGAAAERNPSVATDGTGYLVAWEDQRAGSANADVYAARITGAGSLLDPGGFAVNTAAGVQFYPVVAFDGVNYLAVWDDLGSGAGRSVRGSRITPQGAVLDTPSLDIWNPGSSSVIPELASDGTNVLVTWRERPNAQYDVRGARVGRSGARLDAPFTITAAYNEQRAPKVATDGANFLVLWNDARTSPAQVRALVLSPAGTAIGPAGFAVAPGANAQWAGGVSFDGTNYLATWQEERGPATGWDVLAARISPQGAVLDPAGIPVAATADDEELPAVAFTSGHHLVVWHSASGASVRGARVLPDGTVLEPDGGFLIGAAVGSYSPPAVAGRPDAGSLVAWEINANLGSADIVGAIVDPDGTASGRFPIAATGIDESMPAAAWGNGSFLAAWTARASGQNDIHGVRVGAGGAVLDSAPTSICSAPGLQMLPAVTFDGAEWVVAWDDARAEPNSDVVGAAVSFAGGLLLTREQPLAADLSSDEGRPALASDGKGTTFVAYERFDSALGTVRVKARTSSAYGLGAPCVDAAGCRSGFCSDGVCCDRACGGSAADCQACSVAQGAITDGVCATRAAFAPCRPAQGECDAAEVCDGVSLACPADVQRPVGSACSTGTCVAATCLAPLTFTSTPPTSVPCGGAFEYAPTGPNASSYTFEVEGPAGMAVEPLTGRLSWSPSAAQAGSHHVTLHARRPGSSVTQDFDVTVAACEEPKPPGCGCAAAGPAVWPWLLLALGTRRQRRPRAG